MNHTRTLRLVAVIFTLAACGLAGAQSNIGVDDKYSWSEHAGWLNWRDADGSLAGVRVHATYLSGYVWGENIGWVHVGDGTPGAGTAYSNTDGSDTGVNIAENGDLSGFGWGENIGWVNFGTPSLGADRARFDAVEGRFRGYAWGENVGWINLDDPTRFVGLDLGPFPDECFLVSDPVSEGVWPFDTSFATTGLDPISDALCPGTFIGQFHQDIWFEYIASETADVEVATCGSGFDTDLAVYQGSCGELVPVACNGDACETSVATPYASRLELSVIAGESYLIRIGGWNGIEAGSGELQIAPLGTPFVRGDCNADGMNDIGDAIFGLSVLFAGAEAPCLDSCNANGDGAFDIADAISVLSFLFSGGAAPSAPFPECGIAPSLGCDSFTACP